MNRHAAKNLSWVRLPLIGTSHAGGGWCVGAILGLHALLGGLELPAPPSDAPPAGDSRSGDAAHRNHRSKLQLASTRCAASLLGEKPRDGDKPRANAAAVGHYAAGVTSPHAAANSTVEVVDVAPSAAGSNHFSDGKQPRACDEQPRARQDARRVDLGHAARARVQSVLALLATRSACP